MKTEDLECRDNQSVKAQKSPVRFASITGVCIAVSLLMLVIVVYYYNTKHIELKIAYRGQGPQAYVSHKLCPDNYKKDWPTGINTYDYTLPMSSFYYIAKYLSINPSETIYPFVFIQTLLFVLSAAFLVQTLFEDEVVTLVSVMVIILSPMAGLNLARFGQGFGSFSPYLYYSFANAFRLFALALFLRNKYIACFVFVGLSIHCHVTMGFFVLMFIAGYFFCKPRAVCDKRVLIGICILLALVIPHIASIISNTGSLSSGDFPADRWVKSTRIFSFHWYPLTMKRFTEYAHKELFPFVLSCLYFFVALRYQDLGNERTKKILVGGGACLVASVIGIVFSDIYPIPFVIKISLQRSTSLITFFAVIYTVYYLWKKMENGNFATVSIAVYTLLVLVFSSPGIAVLPLLVLVALDIKEGSLGCFRLNPDKTLARTSCSVAGLLVLLLSMLAIARNNLSTGILHSVASNLPTRLWSPLQYLDPFSRFDLLIRGGVFKLGSIFLPLLACSVFLAGCVRYCGFLDRKPWRSVIFVMFFFSPLLVVWGLKYKAHQGWYNRYGQVAAMYLDVQLWAENNTAHDAFFMPDPSHYYGWRDFSQRSSFGNLREWGYCAIAYDPSYKTYLEGLKRMKEFGIDIEKVAEKDIKGSKYSIFASKLRFDIRASYYAMSCARLERLCDKYNIDYFIMRKERIKKYRLARLLKRFEVAYQNDRFVVFQATKKKNS